MNEVIAETGHQPGDIDWLIPHQANIRIIDGMQKSLAYQQKKL